MEKICILFIALMFCSTTPLLAQNNRKVSGAVTDTSKTMLSEVNVRLIIGKDTLSTTTDNEGYFSFSKINAENFSILVTTMGYQKFSGAYTFEKNEKHKHLATIALKLSGEMLKEVVIKAKPNPIRFMRDTVEYNADAFQVREGDNVADLLKQFPGLEVDDEYNVKTMGTEMVKLRVNGKDFFTSNVKEFIGKLPAGIVSKIQVIDDFGDEANFTGIKIGEPSKMLNIITKPGMNKGTFGNLSANVGTNNLLGSNANVNLWNDNKQSGGSVNHRTLNNGAGNSSNLGIAVNHRDKMGKFGNIGLNYNFGINTNAFANEQMLETVNPLGNFFNNSQSTGDNKGNNHNLNWSYNYNNKKIYLNGFLGASYNQSNNLSSSFNAQYGVIRQDLKNINRSDNKSPRINANLNLSKILKNKRNSFSANFGFSTSASNADQYISTNTLYYNKATGILEKDSLLNRDLISKSDGQNFSFGINYSIGLKKLKDSLARQSLNINYSGGVGKSTSEVSTIVFDNLSNKAMLVDSLSSRYNSISFNQSLGINYNYSNKKMRYNFGINARPNLLSSNYINLNKKIVNNTFNYSPNINISKAISKTKTITVNYSGSNNNPSVFQLQPIRNTQNLQNIVIGNPDLKSSFSHNLNARYNYAHAKSGISIQTGLNFSTTQREIVNNVMLVPDTLNSLKQLTRYENINGNYNLGGNYTLNIPLKKNKYSISYAGTVGLSNRAVFINNEKKFNRGINLSQRLSSNMMLKKFSLNTNLSYNISNNNNNSAVLSSFSEIQTGGLGQINEATLFRSTNFRADFNGNLRLQRITLRAGASYNTTHNNNLTSTTIFGDIKTIDLNLSGSLKIRKSYFVNFNSSKRINSGYTFANSNPLLLGAGLNKTFFKDNSLGLSMNASDLLNQGNNISRYVTGNTIVDSRTNQPTRIFSLGLSYNLSKFGGRNFRVDQD